MEEFILKFKAFVRDKNKLMPLLALICLALIAWAGFNAHSWIDRAGIRGKSGNSGQAASEPIAPKIELVRRWIDGVKVEPGKENVFPIAVMIENHADSRPPAGLSHANLVYEAEAEGGITRFLAVFASGDKIDKIGPVRSARPYYIDWAMDLKGLYVHCGGSPEALAKIINERVLDLNEFYNAPVFWRDSKRAAPHNVFTSTDKLYNYLEKNKIDLKGKSGMVSEWKYKDDLFLENRPEKGGITVFYKGNDFTVQWKYDKITNDYARFQGPTAHVDDDGTPIKAKNVIVQFASTSIIDEEGRRQVATTGKGKAEICLDGQCRAGSWKKKNKNSRTVYYEDDGQEVELNAGTAWVSVVPIGYKIQVDVK